MRWRSALAARLRSLFRRDRLEHDGGRTPLHLDQQIAENIQAGMSPRDAQMSAMRATGSIGIKDQCRESLGLRRIDELRQDVGYACRTLRKNPGFAATAVLSLALGIGAATSVYALTFTLFFAPPAGVDQPESLVRICRLANGRPEGHELSYAEYVYYRDHATVFTELASDGNVRTADRYRERRPAAGRRRLTELFHRARTPATRGSLLSPGRRHGRRSRPGRRLEPRLLAEAVRGRLSQHRRTPHARWDVLRDRRRRASELRGLERRLGSRHLRAHPCGLQRGRPREREERTTGPHRPARSLVARSQRRRPRSRSWPAGWSRRHPDTNRGAGLLVSKLRGLDPEARSSQARLPTLLVATVACLLLIACVNLAGLLQTRHAARGKEIAIRLALGAGRRRIVRQLLTESLLLSAFGGAAGLVVAWWGKTLLERAYAREMFDGARHFYPLTLDARAFLLTLLTAAATGVVFGLVPALQASRPVLVPALKEDASAPRRSRLRAAFLVVQVALSLVLLIGAALAIQSARTVWQNPGFDAEHVAYFNIAPARAGYRGEKATLYAGDVRRRLESLPFVESISFSWVPPPFWFSTADIFLPGQNPARPEDALKVPVNWVSARFFDTLRIPVLHGRGIEQRDIDQGRPLVVVNEALARRLWTEQNPVGRTLMVDGRPFEVVGIVRYEGLRAGGETARPYLFCSDTGGRQQGSLLVRVKGDAVAALPTLRREILAVDAGVPINQAMSLTSVIANQEADVPIAMGVLSFAGGLALLLTTLGLYGVVALWVGQRTREIGIRVALGARVGRQS